MYLDISHHYFNTFGETRQINLRLQHLSQTGPTWVRPGRTESATNVKAEVQPLNHLPKLLNSFSHKKRVCNHLLQLYFSENIEVSCSILVNTNTVHCTCGEGGAATLEYCNGQAKVRRTGRKKEPDFQNNDIGI